MKKSLFFSIVLYASSFLASQPGLYEAKIYVYNPENIKKYKNMNEALENLQQIFEENQKTFDEAQTYLYSRLQDTVKNYEKTRNLQVRNFEHIARTLLLLRQKVLLNNNLKNNHRMLQITTSLYFGNKAKIIYFFNPNQQNQEFQSFENSLKRVCHQLTSQNNNSVKK